MLVLGRSIGSLHFGCFLGFVRLAAATAPTLFLTLELGLVNSVFHQEVKVDRNVSKQEDKEHDVHQNGRLMRVSLRKDNKQVDEDHCSDFIEDVKLQK